MPDRMNIAYVYDGSFEGLMCCIYESLKNRESPGVIMSQNEYSPTLFPEKMIATDECRAEKVSMGIKAKISQQALELIQSVYLSCQKERELLVCDFARLGFANGRKVTALLGNDTVSTMLDAAKHLGWEVNKFTGFVRFSIYDGALVAVIEPKNFILPYLAPHFCDRYKNESFMIYDKTHSAALIYRPYEYNIVPISNFEEPDADGEELYYRRLWKMFYDTIGIKERENPRCRMSFMPKRYWKHMTEMQDESYFLPAKNQDAKQLENPIKTTLTP